MEDYVGYELPAKFLEVDEVRTGRGHGSGRQTQWLGRDTTQSNIRGKACRMLLCDARKFSYAAGQANTSG
jgi:hypothetical protein